MTCEAAELRRQADEAQARALEAERQERQIATESTPAAQDATMAEGSYPQSAEESGPDAIEPSSGEEGWQKV